MVRRGLALGVLFANVQKPDHIDCMLSHRINHNVIRVDNEFAGPRDPSLPPDFRKLHQQIKLARDLFPKPFGCGSVLRGDIGQRIAILATGFSFPAKLSHVLP